MTIDNWISLAGIFSGIGAFFLGLKKYQDSLEQRSEVLKQRIEAQRQYQRAQDWKRLEFIAKEMRMFVDKAEVRNAIDMMSWLYKSIEFFPDSKLPARNFYERVHCDNVNSTFTKLNQCEGMSVLETVISETFEIFFQEVERLNGFIETGLISPEELRPYIYFWVDLLNSPETYAERTFMEKDRLTYINAIQSLKNYVEDEGYPGVTALLNRYQ